MGVDPEVIRSITTVLMEHRQELADAIAQEDIKPLVAKHNQLYTTDTTGHDIKTPPAEMSQLSTIIFLHINSPQKINF